MIGISLAIGSTGARASQVMASFGPPPDYMGVNSQAVSLQRQQAHIPYTLEPFPEL